MIYGNGALMGFTPQQVKKMTFWEFSCAFNAWCKFNGVKSSGGGEATIEELMAAGIE